MNDEHKYDDIINLEHHVSKTHKQMSIEERSAQFAPFAALTGYEDEVKETERITERMIEITEDIRSILDEKIHLIQNKIVEQPEVTITYFIADSNKQGGKYQTINGKVKKIDDYKKRIILTNNTDILIKDIIEISSNIFKQ